MILIFLLHLSGEAMIIEAHLEADNNFQKMR